MPPARSSSGGPCWFNRFNSVKYRRSFREIAQDRLDECRLGSVLQHRIETALLANRGMQFVADAASAQRPCAVAGMNLDVISQRQELLKDRDVKVAGEFPPALRPQKIRAPHGAHEQGVARQHTLRIARMLDQKRYVLRSVTGSMQRRDGQVAETELFSIARFSMRNAQTGARSGDDLGTRGRQFVRPRHEIGVHVRLDGKRKREAVLPRELYVDVDVTTGIHDRRQARAIAADHE